MSLIAQGYGPNSKVGNKQLLQGGKRASKTRFAPSGIPRPMAGTGKLPWFERGGFDMNRGGVDRGAGRDCALGSRRGARQAAAAEAAASGAALAGGVASASFSYSTWRAWRWGGRGGEGGLKRALPSARGLQTALDQVGRWLHSGVA